MPGIVGILTKLPRNRVEPQLLQMVDAIRHEPFYVTGTWLDEPMGVYVGWAARKNSFADGMPVSNERGDAVLVFAGEEYPDPGTANGLKARGHEVPADGPSYLVHLYEEDATFPACLNGRFHGLLTDRTKGTSTLFNDRYGMQRIYYYECPEGLYFAAEAKAILRVRPELRSVDPVALGEFISCGCPLENRTIFQDIHVLPPASAWVFEGGEIKSKGKYFQAREWEDQTLLDQETYYQQLREVFARILPRYFSGPEPVGISLTGGLDTRMIMAWHKAAPGLLPCYSFGGMYRDSQDVKIARRVAKASGQPHQVIPLGKEFLSNFSHYAERTVYLTDGCLPISHCPDLYVNEKARLIAPVRMTGNYGGEVLRRVRAFKAENPPPGLFSSQVLAQVGAARETYQRLIQTNPLSFSVFRQAPWHHFGLSSLEQTQLALRSPFLDNEFVRTVFRAPQSACQNNDVCLRLIADGDAKLARIRTDRGLGAGREGLGAALLRGYLEFTFKSEYAYDYGMPQSVAQIDHLFSFMHFERLFLGRHKFYHFRVWYRDALASYVRDVLLDPKALSRPYIERKALENIVLGHLKGNRNYTTSIHTLLTLELLHRLFLDSN